MKYYLHDSTAFEDEKITELYMKFGYEGLGLFYTILEKLALQEKPVKTQVLKKQLNVKKRLEKCWSFMEEIALISSNNGETFNKQLLNFSEKYQIKKIKNAERISQWRKNQDDKENVTRSEFVRNTPKDKISKVNRSKDIITPSVDDVIAYFKLKGYSDLSAKKFHEYYTEGEWKDSKGNKVRNWKQKAQAVWFKEENRIIVSSLPMSPR